MLTCRQQHVVDIVNIKKVDKNLFHTENCVFLGFYAAYSGNSLPNFRATNRSRLQVLRNPRKKTGHTELCGLYRGRWDW